MSRTTDVQALHDLLPEGHVQLVDVREPGEFATGHVPGAVNVPMGRLAGRMADLDRTVAVHLVCRSGNRSGAMADLLTASGFDAVNVSGGTDAWLAAGYPTTAGA